MDICMTQESMYYFITLTEMKFTKVRDILTLFSNSGPVKYVWANDLFCLFKGTPA